MGVHLSPCWLGACSQLLVLPLSSLTCEVLPLLPSSLEHPGLHRTEDAGRRQSWASVRRWVKLLWFWLRYQVLP